MKRYARFHPSLRNDILENSTQRMTVFFLKRAGDFDISSLPANVGLRKVTRIGLLRGIRQEKWDVLEVPEPLWLRQWPLAALLISVARRSCPNLTVCTYAIENLRLEERTSPPSWLPNGMNRISRRLILAALKVTSNGIDRWAFGTSASAELYTLNGLCRSKTVRVIPQELPTCSCPLSTPAEPGKPWALFVGELSERKGALVLVDAWRTVMRVLPEAKLVLAGGGPLRESLQEALPEAEIVGLVDRSTLHGLLRRRPVLVLPSVRVPRWREQVGLPLLEGEAHGCALVTSSESGIAKHILERARVPISIVAPKDAEALSEALLAALGGQKRGATYEAWGGTSANSRAEVERWFCA